MLRHVKHVLTDGPKQSARQQTTGSSMTGKRNALL